MRLAFACQAPMLMLLALGLPAHAEAGSFVMVVSSQDPERDAILAGIGSTVAFVDANANGRLDATQPDEPVYLETNHDGQVGYADIRLTAFGAYPPGSLVGVTNADNGRRLTTTGWFASSTTGDWYVDIDQSRTVTAGDLRLADRHPSKVGAGDADAGTALQPAQSGVSSTSRLTVRDTSRDGAYQPGEALYLDLDANQGPGTLRVSAGDLLLSPAAAPVDTAPDAPGTGTATTSTQPATVTVGTDGTTTVVQQSAPSGWRTLDWILVALSIANLAAFIFVVRTAKPRNPFR